MLVARPMLAALVRRLPVPVAAWLGRRLGDLAWMALARRRRTALDNLAVAFPELGRAERGRLARRSFQHVGLMSVELCSALTDPPEATLSRIDVDGLDHLERVMATHGRAMLVTAHLGNWELLSFVHRLTGFPLAIVVRRLDAGWLDAVVRRLREAASVEIIDKRDAVRPVLAALRRGWMVAILLDQNATRREGVFVPFFGRAASTSRSVAAIAVRTGTPVVPLFIRRAGDGRHAVTIEEALVPPRDRASEEAIAELTAVCARTIEAAIRRAPEQWLWMHARWRTRPPGERV
ncbi:MAG: lysophospholipid acyltransferase family protein [Candidatus Rokubacteria bacterium]|nr:lysophospholipid acyltransferase family protein [Candidatus Rokubacteria bacterium]